MAMRPAFAQQGFILTAVLWFLALMVLVLGTVALRLDYHLQSGQVSRQRTLLAEEAFSAEARIKYWLAARPRQDNGVDLGNGELLQADGTVYSLGPRLRFALLDEESYLNLRFVEAWQVGHYLAAQGVPHDRLPALLDGLEDYADADDLPRPHGAERWQYAQKSNAAPSNYWLQSVRELWQVLGWREQLTPGQRQALMEDATVWGQARLKPNSASPRVLRAIPGMDEGKLAVLLRERAERPFRDIGDFATRLGLSRETLGDEDRYGWRMGTFVRLTFWLDGQSGGIQETLWTDGNTDRPGPWAVEYQIHVALADRWLASPSKALAQ